MVYFVKFLYSTFLFPPGIIILGLVLLCFFLYRNNHRGVRLLGLLTVGFYLCTISFVSDRLLNPLEGKYHPPSVVSGDVIVMLGGGATLDTPNVNGLGHLSGFSANRLLTCAQLYHKLKVPIVVSGGKVLETTGCEAEIARGILIGLGIPEKDVIIENRSLNTTENARFTKEIMERYNFRRPILVTSAFHMERAVLQFNKVNVTVTPYPTDYQTNVEIRFQPHHLWPSAGALQDVSLALKEYVGILAVKWY